MIVLIHRRRIVRLKRSERPRTTVCIIHTPRVAVKHFFKAQRGSCAGRAAEKQENCLLIAIYHRDSAGMPHASSVPRTYFSSSAVRASHGVDASEMIALI